MREQGGGGTSPDQNPATPNNGVSPGPSDDQEFLTVASNSRTARKSTVVVVILVAIGLLGLWFMIRRSEPEAANANQSAEDTSRLESAISRVTGVSSEMVSRMDQIVKKFHEFSDVFQVQVNDLAKDPFDVGTSTGPLDEIPLVPEDPEVMAARLRLKRMEEQAEKLELLSVMRSDDGLCCMINDRILQEGDSIRQFTVTEIGGDFVELTWQPTDEAADTVITETLTTTLKLSQ
jgi:hypothetical protein